MHGIKTDRQRCK